MSIISDVEAIRYILSGLNEQTPNPHFACYLGAGASAEAGVKMAAQICNEIYEELRQLRRLAAQDADHERELKKKLKWDDLRSRYATCIEECYPDRALRVAYFRKMLKGVAPSFSHHALALLIHKRYFKNTCLTTNFDKLLESAFIQQGHSECQPIRNDEERRFWSSEEDRYYVIKLHGDYDTHNVLNTSDETVLISEQLLDDTCRLLDSAGLVVIGTAGYETSVFTLFNYLSRKGGRILSRGLLWGVYVGTAKPDGITDEEIRTLVKEKLAQGIVSQDICSMIERNSAGRLFRFFPVWGTGNFFYKLIKSTQNKEIKGAVSLYLDREMRLRHVFDKAGLPKDAINAHLTQLEQKRTRPVDGEARGSSPVEVFQATSQSSQVTLRIFYGDITSRTFMGKDEFEAFRRAVISPDDIFITAGGGVAESFLEKAGQRFILNEVAKFSPIPLGAVAVTSAGNLPVQYIFHAAAIQVERNASYTVSRQSVYTATLAALHKASALEVGALWVPLMGTGVAGLPAKESLEGILEAIAKWEQTNSLPNMILIFIYKHTILETHDVYKLMKAKLTPRFVISKKSS
ncbi:MAG: macro domain-containing protein [Blastocatellia bacterium]